MAQLDLSLREESGRSRPLSVSEVVRAADRILERQFSGICVEGEIAGLSLPQSGHAFFSLRDDAAVISVAMWRSARRRLRFELEDGQRVRVFGRLGIYDRQGRFQLYADRAEPVGLGELMLQLEALKRRLAEEGLFDVERKRPLPKWPRTVGIVTSRSGAVVHDVIEVARRRCPTHVLLSPAQVQGPDAPQSLIDALERLQRREGVDVIIIGRGGGSLEDLWAFNDERLARAIVAARVPVVAAVGHEVDVTIAGLAADVRAATPSQAAELVVPDLAQRAEILRMLQGRLARALERRALDERSRIDAAVAELRRAGERITRAARSRLDGLQTRLVVRHPRARAAADRHALEQLRSRLESAGRGLTAASRLRLARSGTALSALSPLAVLARGYAVATDARTGRAVVDAGAVAEGDDIELRLHRGRLRARVVGKVDS